MSLSQRERAYIIANTYKNWDIRSKRVLDVGCGNGEVSQILKERLNLDLYGTDIIGYCKTGIPFRKMGEDGHLPFEDMSFDYVMYNDVLHHSERIEALLTEGIRVGRGLLVFEDRQSFLLKIYDILLNRFYCSKMPPPANYKTQEAWCQLFDKLGLSCEIGGVSYPFWYPIRHMVFRLFDKK